MHAATHFLLFFDPDSRLRREHRLQEKKAPAAAHERRLFCARCRHPVTHQDARIQISGSHEHQFTNPHGLTFRIGCFREAPGCVADGEATAAFSWFPGHAWRVALCANCKFHLGWEFSAAADGFHGLINERLTSRAGRT